MATIEGQMFEFFDSLDFFLSESFLEKYRYKYSSFFIRTLQLKLLSLMSDNKTIQTHKLSAFLSTKTGISIKVVKEFFRETELESELYPMVLT